VNTLVEFTKSEFFLNRRFLKKQDT